MSPLAPVYLPTVGKTVHRLGLATNYGIDDAGVRSAIIDGPLRYLYWTPTHRKATAAVRDALARDRDAYVLATGPTLAYWGGGLQGFVDKVRKSLQIDQIDILQLHWLGVTSAWTEGTRDALVKVRENGSVKAIGVSIHDRPRAALLAQEGVLDQFMLRYNAAHPGAEREIFPSLDANRHVVCAYTATRWRKLLKRPSGWTGPVMTAGDCYRFCLSDPHVHVVLTAPKDKAQLGENLSAVEKGTLDPDEMRWIRDFGKAVHG